MTYANIRPANMFDMLTDIQHVLVFNLLEPFSWILYIWNLEE